MGAYSYKYVRDLLPPYLTDDVEDYEGDAGYDGDQWIAASTYIESLERELAGQYAVTGHMADAELLGWLTGRQKAGYCHGPAIVSAPVGQEASDD